MRGCSVIGGRTWVGVLVLGVVHLPDLLQAQGLTGAAVQGSVISAADSVPIEAAVVDVTNASNGERWQTVTRWRGRYFLENLSLGGPYRITVRAIGFEPEELTGVFLSLGQRLTADFVLIPAPVQLSEIAVYAEVDPLINPGRTGPAQTIPDSTIVRLPVDSRDFAQLALLSPQVTPGTAGLSFAGQPDRLNALQIDGASNQDRFGLTTSGIGTAAGVPPLAPEALKEVQIVTAPFDVRFGNFAGGLLNAVSKSGSNRFQGSAFGYLQSQDLTGKDTNGSRATAFNDKQLGITLGGPIVSDRIAFFVSGGLSRQVLPQLVPAIGTDTIGGRDSVGIGIRYASAVRFRDILSTKYGVDAGTFSFAADRTPAGNLFAKVTAQLGVNSRLDVSHNYIHLTAQDNTGARDVGAYSLSSYDRAIPTTTNATRATWAAALGRRFTNELILARLAENDKCIPAANYASVIVGADAGVLLAGAGAECVGNFGGQSTLELTDNFGLMAGAHRLTFGTHDEVIHLQNVTVLQRNGSWEFDSLDSLEQGLPSSYTRDIPGPLRPDGPLADFRVNQLGFYAQDQWTPTERLTVTTGLRLDVPFLPRAPVQNPTLLSQLGINTAVTPTGNPLWSPRLGVSYDVSGRGSTFLRGGIGLFGGPPAYFWFAQAYANTGLEQVRLTCTGADVPAFTLDPNDQPTACGTGTQPVPSVVSFDPSFQFPQNLRVGLGIDHRLPGGVVGTLDFLYTRGIHQFEEWDANLLPPSGVSPGEGGRLRYGSIDPASGQATPNRRSPDFRPVIRIRNGHGDRAYLLTVQLQRPFANGMTLSGAYTYLDAKDRISPDGDFAFTNLAATPLDGTLADRNLRTSLYSIPHKITLVGALDLPLSLRLSLIYQAYSGRALTYVVRGDANADGSERFGYRHNDIVYVPKDPNDITLTDRGQYAQLDQYIQSEPCLRSQRGRILERNSCRDPWINVTSARLAKVFGLPRGQSLEVRADVFNLLNLLNGKWGLVRRTLQDRGFRAAGQVVDLLQLVGYDTVNGRGIYDVLAPLHNQIDPDASRWRLQLSAQYAF